MASSSSPLDHHNCFIGKVQTSDAPELPNSPTVITKDITINEWNKTWFRIYIPREVLNSSSSTKLPLIVYNHGGGFILFSAAMPIIHKFCCNVAVAIPAIVISIDYRLAPAHRLPAAYNDCMEALHCIKTTKVDLLTNYGDFSNCYIMGSSSGGNIAYRTALSCVRYDLQPLKIKGFIMHQPYFGGVQRTESELRMADDPIVPLVFNDSCWASALPFGADRDHEYCNPTVGGGSPLWDQIKQLGWKFLVTGCDGDPLVDRQTRFVKMVDEKGVEVVGEFVEGGSHGIEFTDPSKAEALFMVIQQFMLS